MLFLLNQTMIDVGDPFETLQTLGVSAPVQPKLKMLVELGQDAAFAARGVDNAHDGIQLSLAALFALTGRVNCALFLYPPRAMGRQEVTYRLALAPITTMAYLYSSQQVGRLTPAMINRHIWRVAANAAAA